MKSYNANVNHDRISGMSQAEISELADAIRKQIIESVSKNGGHLASNLGMVEATIALHRVFNSPNDKLIFDVGHQCYAHKLLTGRWDDFNTLREYGGISGFSNRFESNHDILNEGHCGTSISAAIGIATANKIIGCTDYTVAIVGDGALTNGMIYEALNNCADKDLNLIILINDNEMSISENVGGLHKYLSSLRTSKGYFSLKHDTEKILLSVPLVGKALAKTCKKAKDFFKRCFVKNNFFEDMGLIYLGPVDGHNVERLSIVLEEAKSKHKPCIVHMHTQKGRGYVFAEKSPDRYHSVSPFDITKGVELTQKDTFSTKAGEIICQKAVTDSRICAITAAMCEGTGLSEFSKCFSDRFFDVGIAEEHAVTFAAGLSVSGLRPVLFLYSTFAQRVYDQLFHDISIQKIPLVLALDRCGLVPGDGITHQGVFDYALFSSFPGAVIYAPKTYCELEEAFDRALDNSGLSIIRYPKGRENAEDSLETDFLCDQDINFTANTENAEIAIITYGRITHQAVIAKKALKKHCNVGIIQLKKIYPIPTERVFELVSKVKFIYVLEEGIKFGGVGEKIAESFEEHNIHKKLIVRAIENYVEHGNLESLLRSCNLSAEQVVEEIVKFRGGIK